ncbi:MAG: hypothetical protein KJ047_02465 [Anaerolineae bacterium]|nr:hypothetical protein [Anaerolineae bacterium]
MNHLNLTSQEAAFDFLDSYASARKEEIDRRKLSKDSGFIKSYSLETSPTNGGVAFDQSYIERLVDDVRWRISPIGQQNFFRADDSEGLVGFIDILSERHLAFHTFREARRMDQVICNLVNRSSRLDFLWLSGNYLNLLWEGLIREYMPQRFVTFKFEHQGRFEDVEWDGVGDDESEETGEESDEDTEIRERRASTLKVTARVNKVSRFLPQLQSVLPDFKAIKMLRIPATEMPGGYEFWDWGKVTYRSPNFRDGRGYLREITQSYQKVTEFIEQQTWFQAEKIHLHDGTETLNLTGTPITFRFPEPLALGTFQGFVEATFERGKGPFRLWGNPLRLSDRKVHVYGLDLHLWQRIFLELTPSGFTAILPKHTCGNTIHRLVSNIQRFISPDVETYVGEKSYQNIVKEMLLYGT